MADDILNISSLHILIGRMLAHTELLQETHPYIAHDMHEATQLLDILCEHLTELAKLLPPPIDLPESSRSSHYSP
jgi:hypothetical protein